jgi:predicted TIM-barrel fold metal-dependent hydrolase
VPRVDCQSHVFPPAYAELLKRNPRAPTTTGDYGAYAVSYGDVQRFTLRVADYDPARKLRAMDAAGIDVSVLSVNIPGPELLSPDLALAGARLCNDYLAETCARYPGRFVGLASLPLGDVPAALAELDRAVNALDLRGALLPSHVAGAPLDAPQFESFYRHAAARGVPLVLHPTVPTWGGAIADHAMIPMLGFMVDTSIAVLRLILGGVLERHPALLVVHPHAGGVLPYLMGRVEEQTEVKGRACEHITRPPGEYYRRVYLDLVSPSALALRYAYDFAGPDRLLFGSDHPWVPMDDFVALVEGLDIPAEDKTKIFGLNACELFKIGHPVAGRRSGEADGWREAGAVAHTAPH